jgi:very-short-patch-repair endonuclease
MEITFLRPGNSLCFPLQGGAGVGYSSEGQGWGIPGTLIAEKPTGLPEAAMSPDFLPYNPRLKEIARQLRQNMTHSEVILWQHLKGKQMQGFDFDRQKPIDEYIVDFYCKKLKLAIEIDGASHDSQEAQAQDRYRQARLEAYGIRFLRFRDDEVRKQTEIVLQTIQAWVMNPPEP